MPGYNANMLAQVLSTPGNQWINVPQSGYRECFHGSTSPNNPNCVLHVGNKESGYYSFKNSQSLSMHPYTFLEKAKPAINYIHKKISQAGLQVLAILPKISYSYDSIILFGASSNFSCTVKLKGSINFKCLESLTAKYLQKNLHNNKLVLSVENKYNEIFNSVDVNLGNFNDFNTSVGLKFKVIDGMNYTLSCKPVIISGFINAFEGSGELMKSINMKIDGIKFEVNVNMGYGVVIEQHNNLNLQSPTVSIPKLAPEKNLYNFGVKPVVVNNNSKAQINSFPMQNSNLHGARIIRNHKESSTTNWYMAVRNTIYTGGMLMGISLIQKYQSYGSISTKFSKNLKPSTATCIAVDAAFGLIVGLSSRALLVLSPIK